MAYDFNLTQIDNTDTFKEWADKCNAIIDGLNSTDFITQTAGIMTLASNQTVTGQKTFSQSASFNGGFTTLGNYTLGGAIGVVNTPTFTVNSGDATIGDGFEVVGSKGIRFKSSSTANAASLKFENAGTPQKLVFDYAGSGGIFEIGDGNKLALGGSSPTLTVNDYDWNLPSSSPGITPSILKWTGSGSQLSWLAESALAADIVSDVKDLLQSSNFTLPVTLIPVGTMIAVDARILDSWAVTGSPEEYAIWSGAPGWLPCDGQTISYDETASPEDATYKQLVELLEGIDSPSGSTTLPDTVSSPGGEAPIGGNSIVYLIKYKEDATTAFAVSTTTGGVGASGIDLFNTSNTEVGSFDITGGKIGLNIDTSVFSFNGDGELTAAVDTAATANTIAKRNSDGSLTVAEPTADSHAATRAHVSSAIDDKRGSVIAFPELVDGHQVSGGNRDQTSWGMTVVDRYKRGVFGGLPKSERNGKDGGSNPNGMFNTFSPVTDKEAVFERTLITTFNYFFIDSDDIIYGSGNNTYGMIGQRDRGTAGDFTDYYDYSYVSSAQKAAIYNDDTVEMPLPAMLPQKTLWPANAVTVDTITHSPTGGLARGSNMLIKTKDGIGNNYVSGDRLQGLETYQTDSGVPYTRGWLISTMYGYYGGLGNRTQGDAAHTGKASGPAIYGLGSAGQSLWTVFGITDAERAAGITTAMAADSTFTDKVNKRFHYYKRNATEAGGLAEASDAAALAAWQTALGLTGGETFDDYSYYVKKAVITEETSYLIVGKPGNESENELWTAGYGAYGQTGNGTSNSNTRVHVPATNASGTTLSGISVVTGALVPINKVFQSTTAHGFEDFEQIRINNGVSRYYIVRGDHLNQNLTTHFRLFKYTDEHLAQDAIRDGGTTSAYANVALGTQVLTHFEKVKGIFDISVGASNRSADYWLARRTTDTKTDSTQLDSLPESAFDQVTVMGCGYNAYGQLGTGDQTNKTVPVTVSLGTADRPVDIIAIRQGYNSFVVTENSDGNRSIHATGRNVGGLMDVGTTASNTVSFTTSTTIDSGWWVKKVFAASGTTWSTGYTGTIWIVAQSKTNPDIYALYAGGNKFRGALGITTTSGASTEKYHRIPFPEDPKNIVAIRTEYTTASHALCKTEEAGETAEEFKLKPGRMYGTGFAANRFDNGTGTKEKHAWYPMDGSILST